MPVPSWKDVPALVKAFRKHASDTSSGSNDLTMNHIQASDFLQKHGKTRTGSERKAELTDVDINNDGQISFIEYLLLHYKVMILTEFYKRYELSPVEDLSNDGIGVIDVGHKLVDELLTMPKGMDPALEVHGRAGLPSALSESTGVSRPSRLLPPPFVSPLPRFMPPSSPH